MDDHGTKETKLIQLDLTARSGMDGFQPQLKSGITVYDRGDGEPASRYVLHREETDTFLILSANEYMLTHYFDGEHTVGEINQDYLTRFRQLILPLLASLLQKLYRHGMLAPDRILADMISTDESASDVRAPIITRLIHFQVNLPLTRLLSRIVGAVLAVINPASRMVMSLAALVVICGVVAGVMASGEIWYPLFKLTTYLDPEVNTVLDRYIYGVLVLFGLHLILSFAGSNIKSASQGVYTGRVEPVSFGLRYGFPCFSMSSRWRIVLSLHHRLVAGLVGIAFDLLVASVAAIALACIQNGVFGQAIYGHMWVPELIYKVMWVAMIRVFMHFAPLVRADLQEVVSGWSGIEAISVRTMGFMRRHFYVTLFGSGRLTHEQKFYLGYSAVVIFWVITGTVIGGDLVIANREIFQDVTNLLDEGHEMLPMVMLGLLALPILALAFLALYWAGGVVLSWIREQKLWDHPNRVMTAGIVFHLVLIAVLMRTAGPELIRILSFATLILALLVVLKAIRMFGTSRFGARYVLMMGALFCLGGSMMSARVQGGSSVAIAMLVFIGLFFVYSDLQRCGVISCLRSKLGLADLVVTIGLFIIVFYGLLEASILKAAPDIGEVAVQKLVFVGTGFLIIGLLGVFVVVRRPVMPVRSEFDPADLVPTPESLNLMLARITGNVAYAAAERFGGAAAAQLERKVRSRLGEGSTAFSMTGGWPPEKGVSLEEAGRKYGGICLAVRDSLVKQYGTRIGSEMIETALCRFALEARMLIHAHLLRDTPWKNRFGLEHLMGIEVRIKQLEKIGFLESMPTSLKVMLASTMEMKKYPGDSLLLTQGEEAPAMYIVLEGNLQAEEEDLSGRANVIGFLAPGDYLGESVLMEGALAVASVRCSREVTALVLHRDDVRSIVADRPEIVESFRTQLQIARYLIKIKLFNEVPINLLRAIVSKLKMSSHRAGEVIIHQGEIGSELYMILTGGVEVIFAEKGKEEKIAELGPRDYFGEIALIKDAPRAASIRANQRTECLVLQKSDFIRLMGNCEVLSARMESVTAERLTMLKVGG